MGGIASLSGGSGGGGGGGPASSAATTQSLDFGDDYYGSIGPAAPPGSQSPGWLIPLVIGVVGSLIAAILYTRK